MTKREYRYRNNLPNPRKILMKQVFNNMARDEYDRQITVFKKLYKEKIIENAKNGYLAVPEFGL